MKPIMEILLFLCIFLVCSSKSIWTLWLGLEMFNFFFLPWLVENSDKLKSTKLFFYFMIQTIASSMFLLGTVNCMNSVLFYGLALMGLFVKLGVFPFHMWVPYLIDNMSWKKYSFLMTFSKMGPLSAMYMLQPVLNMIYIILGGVLAPLSSLKTSSLRKMLGFSSISHMSWLLIALILSKGLMMFYIVLYWVIFYISCVTNFPQNFMSLKDMMFKPNSNMLDLILILCLMGFPPFLGFFPKLFVLKNMCDFSFFLEAMFMGTASIFVFFFYLKMILMYSMSYSKSIYSYIKPKVNKKSYLIFSVVLIFAGTEIFVCFCL